MNNFYEQFVTLSLMMCSKSDYNDLNKVKKHNKALSKLAELTQSIDINDNIDVLNLLLLHEDSRVKINAASLCIEKHVLTALSTKVLSQIIDSCDDSTMCFSAKMLLKSFKNNEGL